MDILLILDKDRPNRKQKLTKHSDEIIGIMQR